MEVSEREYELAIKRAAEMKQTVPFALEVQVEHASRQLVITLSTGAALRVPLGAFAELATAGQAQLSGAEISPSGYGIYFPRLDVDLYVPALLEQFGAPPPTPA